MPRLCSICSHPDRERIDELLIQSIPNRQIAIKFGLKDPAVGRHRHNHLLPQLGHARESRRQRVAVDAVLAKASEPFDLYERVELLHSQAQDLLKHAQASGNYAPAVSAIRECTRLCELWAKVEGTLQSGTQINTQVVITQSPEWVELRTAILRALERHPAAKLAVSRALEGLRDSHMQSDSPPGGPR